MKSLRLAAIPTIAITSLLLILAPGYSGFAQTPAPPPTLAPPLISLAEARVIIDGAVAFTRDQNLNMAVVVVDAAGNLVSADKMDGTTINNTHFAEGKAFASAILRQTTEVLANLAKERPDRYFGIMNMYPGKVYLVGGAFEGGGPWMSVSLSTSLLWSTKAVLRRRLICWESLSPRWACRFAS